MVEEARGGEFELLCGGFDGLEVVVGDKHG